MAAGQIKITPETMRQRATQYRKEANEVHASYSNMDALLRTLHTEWEGRAADSYDARYQSLRPNFLKTEDLINDIAKSLDNTAATLEQTDQNIANAY